MILHEDHVEVGGLDDKAVSSRGDNLMLSGDAGMDIGWRIPGGTIHPGFLGRFRDGHRPSLQLGNYSYKRKN